MERINALGRGAQLMLVGAVLLFIDLFLPWQDFGNDLTDAVGVDASFSGWRGFAGFVLGLLTIVLLAWLIVRLASVNIPLPVSTAMTAALIGTLILIFAIIKLLTILGDEATFWAWIGLALAIVIAVGAFQTVQEAGGVENLQQEASTFTSSGGGGAAAAAGGAAVAAGGAAESPDAAADEPTEAAGGAEPAANAADSAMGSAQEAAQAEGAAAGGAPDAAQDAVSGADEAAGDAADAATEAASDLTEGPSTGTGA